MSLIPATFHFVYGLRPQDAPFPLVHFLALRSCLDHHPDFDVVVHLEQEPWGPWWDRIRPHVRIERVGDDDSPLDHDGAGRPFADFSYAHRADVVRLDVLLREGGVYADMDSIFVARLPEELREHEAVMGHERAPDGAPGSLCNAWIAAAPGSRFIAAWREEMVEAFDGSWSNHSTVLPYRLSERMPDTVHVEPESRFFALDWTREGIADLFDRDVDLPADCVSLHLWEHLWGSPQRRDFSDFDRDQLTPDYVAHATTTYARLARPHLPADVPTSARALRGQQRARSRARVRHRIASRLARARRAGQSR